VTLEFNAVIGEDEEEVMLRALKERKVVVWEIAIVWRKVVPLTMIGLEELSERRVFAQNME
jgi:hypothetical protein